jgi:hypothetical protein
LPFVCLKKKTKMNPFQIVFPILFSVLASSSVLIIFGPEIADLPREFDKLELSRASLNQTVTPGIFTRFNAVSRETELYIIHTQQVTSSLQDSQCCSYYSQGIHWRDRNIPTKVFQSASAAALTERVTAAWNVAGTAPLFGLVLSSNLVYTEPAISEAWASSINTVGFKAISGDFADALAITRLAIDQTGQHYTHSAIIVNAALIGSVCDAAFNSACYDFETILSHEFGHVWGLLDEYSSACSPNLMYGSLSPGDTHKRTIDTLTRQCATRLYSEAPIAREPEGPRGGSATGGGSAPRAFNLVLLFWVVLCLL